MSIPNRHIESHGRFYPTLVLFIIFFNLPQDRMSQYRVISFHPEMKENTQKYIDEVIKRINKGEMKGFSFYPEAVARTLYEQSDGKLEVNVQGVQAED